VKKMVGGAGEGRIVFERERERESVYVCVCVKLLLGDKFAFI
jgi:hypothetical protein